VKSVWFVGILMNFFILGLYIFTGVCVASLELFGGDAVAPICHVVEGLAPYVFDASINYWMDNVSDGLYAQNYAVANTLADADNYRAAVAFLQREAGRAPQFEHIRICLPDRLELFFTHIPASTETMSGIYYPKFVSQWDWVLKFFCNVLPQKQLSDYVLFIISPNGPKGLWFLMAFDCSY